MVHNNPSDPLNLWTLFKKSLSEDFARKLNDSEESEKYAYVAIDDILKKENKSITDFAKMPVVPQLQPINAINNTFNPVEELALADSSTKK